MNKQLYNKLSKYEKLLSSVYYSRVLFNAKRLFLNEIADAWEQHTDETINRQWSCAHCAFNFLDKVGAAYFNYKPEPEKEDTTTGTTKKKTVKTNKTKKKTNASTKKTK